MGFFLVFVCGKIKYFLQASLIKMGTYKVTIMVYFSKRKINKVYCQTSRNGRQRMFSFYGPKIQSGKGVGKIIGQKGSEKHFIFFSVYEKTFLLSYLRSHGTVLNNI